MVKFLNQCNLLAELFIVFVLINLYWSVGASEYNVTLYSERKILPLVLFNTLIDYSLFSPYTKEVNEIDRYIGLKCKIVARNTCLRIWEAVNTTKYGKKTIP